MATKRITAVNDSPAVTAADVSRFENPGDIQCCNGLIQESIAETLHRASCVIEFLSGCDELGDSGGAGADARFGFTLCLEYVRDALEMQAEAIDPRRQGSRHE